MDQSQIIQLGDELYEALSTGKTVTPLTSRGFEISIEEAYHIQQQMLSRRIAAGEKVIGKKIGVTSHAVMNMLGVHQPDFGYLLDGMVYNEGESIEMSTLIQPKAEGEIAFILKKDLMGPGVSNADVLAATNCRYGVGYVPDHPASLAWIPTLDAGWYITFGAYGGSGVRSASFAPVIRVRQEILAGGVRNLAQVFGTEWRPALVRMAQRRPADFAPYTAFFRAPVLFGDSLIGRSASNFSPIFPVAKSTS